MIKKNYFLSTILGIRVLNKENGTIGKISDVIIINKDNPVVVALKVSHKRRIKYIATSNIRIDTVYGRILVQVPGEKEWTPAPDSIALKKQVLDKQIVDIEGKKIVRVNDLQLSLKGDSYVVVAVDVGIEGLLRRLGLNIINDGIQKIFKNNAGKFILWRDIEALIPPYNNLKLSTSFTRLSTLHPSELADIIEELDINTSLAIIESLEEEHAADVIEELKPTVQTNILQALPLGKAADLLENMPADEAADILDDLDEIRAEELLNEMESNASQEVLELMEYGDDHTAGGIMSHDFIKLQETTTVREFLESIQKEEPEAETVQALYVVDSAERLCGVIPLKNLLLASETQMAKDIMHKHPIAITTKKHINDITAVMMKYNLLVLPVIEDDGVLVGSIILTDITHELTKTKRG